MKIRVFSVYCAVFVRKGSVFELYRGRRRIRRLARPKRSHMHTQHENTRKQAYSRSSLHNDRYESPLHTLGRVKVGFWTASLP